jgi:biotin synthase-like enzyme
MNLVLQSKLLSKKEIIEYNPKFRDSIIQNFVIGKSWNHVRSKFTDLQIEHIQDTLNGKLTRTLIGLIFKETQTTKLNNIQLGAKYGLTNHTISRIRNKRHKYS